MQALVAAAGFGSRLQPLTDDKPKGMVEVLGKPILTYCFERLVDLDVEELVVTVGYESDKIIRHYGYEFNGIPIKYVHEWEPISVANALLHIEPHISGDFIHLNGENIIRATTSKLETVIEHQQSDGVDGTFLVEEVSLEEAQNYSNCVTDENGNLASLDVRPDEPRSTLKCTGFHTHSEAVFDACRLARESSTKFEFYRAIETLVFTDHTIKAVTTDTRNLCVHTPEERQEVEDYLSEHNKLSA